MGEVAGACFCCSFDELVQTASDFATGNDGHPPPDVILAEPVGSCTDLIATTLLPLREYYGDRFDVAPFGVLVKPSHVARVLAGDEDRRSGFSPQAEYILRKQIEEADYLMIGRADVLSDADREHLRTLLADTAPDVPILTVSPRRGDGVDDVMGRIESSMESGRRVLDIDYDTYADGEAEMGWVNASVAFRADTPVELDRFAVDLVTVIAGGCTGAIAHLKTSVRGGDALSVANAVDSYGGIDLGLRSDRTATGTIETIVNARVAQDPEQLAATIESGCRASGLTVTTYRATHLRPGRPEPVHRFS